jgi:hypothetical protein
MLEELSKVRHWKAELALRSSEEEEGHLRTRKLSVLQLTYLPSVGLAKALVKVAAYMVRIPGLQFG